jgi:hypothetical protein
VARDVQAAEVCCYRASASPRRTIDSAFVIARRVPALPLVELRRSRVTIAQDFSVRRASLATLWRTDFSGFVVHKKFSESIDWPLM